MSESIRIIVGFDVGRLSPNLRLHPTERRRRQRLAKIAARFAWLQAGSPMVEGAVTVSLIVRRGQSLDANAAWAGFKHVEDGLFCRRLNGWGVTPDDSFAWVRYGELRQEIGSDWKGREEVEVIVEPRD
jgi:hypothetical protein